MNSIGCDTKNCSRHRDHPGPHNITPPPTDKINPSHYKSHPSGIQCITIARHYDFNIGSAFKYLWRNGLKDGESSVDDLRKAMWYINDEILKIEQENSVRINPQPLKKVRR